MGLSRASLFNKMKSITGAGAKEYITRIRIEKAKSLMENTDMSIAEIAEKTGFASQSYFSTAFKTSTSCDDAGLYDGSSFLYKRNGTFDFGCKI